MFEEYVATTQTDSLDVSVEGRRGLERRMTVRVPTVEIEKQVDMRLKKVGRTARLKGFRPGKIPPKVVRQRFGRQVRHEVMSDVIQTSYSRALAQERLHPAGDPRIEPVTLGGADHFSYRAIFEVYPEISLKPTEAISVETPKVEIGEADVDEMIDKLRDQQADWQTVQRKSAVGDRVVVDYTAKLGKEPLEGGEGKEVGVVIDSGEVAADFAKGLERVEAGQRKSIKVKFPKDHPSAALAGKRAVYEVTVHRVEEKRLPEVSEEFLQALGIREGGLDALRVELRRNMERELKERVRTAARSRAFDGLLRLNSIDLPKVLVEGETDAMQAEAMRRLGVEDVEQAPPKSHFEVPARRRVALGLLLQEMIEKHQIKLDRARVDERIAELVAPYEDAEGVEQVYRSDRGLMAQVESGVLEDQVVDYILEHGKTREKAVGFKEFMSDGPPRSKPYAGLLNFG